MRCGAGGKRQHPAAKARCKIAAKTITYPKRRIAYVALRDASIDECHSRASICHSRASICHSRENGNPDTYPPLVRRLVRRSASEVGSLSEGGICTCPPEVESKIDTAVPRLTAG